MSLSNKSTFVSEYYNKVILPSQSKVKIFKHKDDKNIIMIYCNKTKFLHSYNDYPALRIYDKYRNIIIYVWYYHGRIHRVNKPAIISYDNNIKHVAYFTDGIYHKKGQNIKDIYYSFIPNRFNIENNFGNNDIDMTIMHILFYICAN